MTTAVVETALLLWVVTLFNDKTSIHITDSWTENNQLCFDATIKTNLGKDGNGWEIHLGTSKPFSTITTSHADITTSSSDGLKHVLANKDWNSQLTADDTFEVPFKACITDSTEQLPNIEGEFRRNEEMCPEQTFQPETPYTWTTMVNIIVDQSTSSFSGYLVVTVDDTVNNGWKIHLAFSRQVVLDVPDAITMPSEGNAFTLENHDWNKEIAAGTDLQVSYVAHIMMNEGPVPCVHAILISKRDTIDPDPTKTSSFPSTTPLLQPSSSSPSTTALLQPSPPSPSVSIVTSIAPRFCGPYNYAEVLHKSILFYEAQRSGALPSTNRIPWRGDSALGDKGLNNEDLTGGWYDAGDFVKFGFPMAFSTTLLTWGLVEFPGAYSSAGELENMLDSIKWPLDYFIKAHVGSNEFYGQVGNGVIDHQYWGRPEEMTMERPAYKIDQENPGSDLAAETAAAMAAGSIAFRQSNSVYSELLLNHSKTLFAFADQYRGTYSSSIPDAGGFYSSSGYNDELVWGAAWLYKATGEESYLQKAEQYFTDYGLGDPAWGFSWDEKVGGVQLLLYELTKKSVYQTAIETSLDAWLPGSGMSYTPKGLAWRLEWGSNRYAANTAFLALLASKLGLKSDVYQEFGKKQIHYMLGDSGRSFVVGFGQNPPLRPHHRSSSCPDLPATCNSDQLNDPEPNPQILYGALVGGPRQDDSYSDVRGDYRSNEVACDYNAGFQSAVAALKELTGSFCSIGVRATSTSSTIRSTSSPIRSTSPVLESQPSPTSSYGKTPVGIMPSTTSPPSPSSTVSSELPPIGPHECGDVEVPSGFKAFELPVELLNDWQDGFTGRITITAPELIRDGWEIVFLLKNPISQLDISNVLPDTSSGSSFILKNQLYNKELTEGSITLIDFTATKANANDEVPCVRAVLRWAIEPPCPVITPLAGYSSMAATVAIGSEWNEGISGQITVIAPEGVDSGWKIQFLVTAELTLTVSDAALSSSTGTEFVLTNLSYNSQLQAGTTLSVSFTGVKVVTGSTVLCSSAVFLW